MPSDAASSDAQCRPNIAHRTLYTALRVPEGQPILVEKFSEAVYLAEASAHGGKPLLVFES
jgi:hypothetical protein